MNEFTPEQQAEIGINGEKLKAQMKAGQLIPGGFGGPGEAIDELQLALETVQKAIALGIAERWQHLLTSRIYNVLAEINLWHDYDVEDD
jgi:hypothetical protein